MRSNAVIINWETLGTEWGMWYVNIHTEPTIESFGFVQGISNILEIPNFDIIFIEIREHDDKSMRKQEKSDYPTSKRQWDWIPMGKMPGAPRLT